MYLFKLLFDQIGQKKIGAKLANIVYKIHKRHVILFVLSFLLFFLFLFISIEPIINNIQACCWNVLN